MSIGGDEDKQLAQELTLRAVELGMSPALGGDVRVELAPRTTVLVGKNGAGKSAILERISEGFGVASRQSGTVTVDPQEFACEFRVDASRSIRYRYQWDLEIERLGESCEQIEPEPRRLWDLDLAGQLRRGQDASVIAWYAARDDTHEFAREIDEWVSLVRRIPSAVEPHERAPVFVLRQHPFMKRNPLASLAIRLDDWKKYRSEEFAELRAVGNRTNLFDDIQFITTDGHQDVFGVEIDGINLGYLSDGTLRAIQIFLELLEPETKLLLIDEPESATHPGLLGRLLAEIDAYSIDRQIILATQSPQVVSWARPEAIRLVERHAGVTSVRALDEITVNRLDRYLHDGDTLSDFIYGGGVDGFAE